MSLPPSQQSNNSNLDLSLIEEISRSILSNLDRDSLLNSVVTLLHQVFGFNKVNIVTLRDGETTRLRKIGISADGLEPEAPCQCDPELSPIGWSISHRELVVINDTAAQSRFSFTEFEGNIQSELVLPLLQGDSLIGVVDLCTSSGSAFNPQAIEAFKRFAVNISIAITNATLYHAEQTRRLISERIQDSAGSLSADHSPEELYTNLLAELANFLPYDAASIWLMDRVSSDNGLEQITSSLRLVGIRCKDPLDINELSPILDNPIDSNELSEKYSWINGAISLKTPSLRSATSTFEPLGARLNYPDNYSALVAPLVIRDIAIGAVVCIAQSPDLYDSESLSIASTFASFSVITIENDRLYRVAHNQAWISTVLLQVAEATQSITDLDDLLETIVSILPGLLDVTACAIFLWESSIETFVESASNGFVDVQASRLEGWSISAGSETAFENLRESGNPVILDETTLSSEAATTIFPAYDLEKDLLLLFPLETQNLLCGAILVDFSGTDLGMNSSQDIWDEKYALIQGAARQAANAIENLQLIKAQEEEAYISAALLQVAQAVVSLSELDEILATIVRITPILVSVKRCMIYLWDGKDQAYHQSQSYGFSKSELSFMGLSIKSAEFPFIETIAQKDRIIYHSLGPEEQPVAWDEIPTGECRVIEYASPDSNDELSISLDASTLPGRNRLLIGFPLSVKNENLGVMLIEEEDPGKGSLSIHIREKRIEIVRGITQQAAIAIKNELLQQEAVNSERMERELQLAREIQATFLPEKIPEIPGWDVAARWQPAREVGGDFYDILLLEGNKIGFVIADVADKGMPAALFMTLIRTLIRAAAKEKSSPAAVLKQVNELLMPDAKQGIFVTVFYGVISVDTGVFTYANAGHNPPMVKRLNGRDISELTRTAIALGIFNDIEVDESELILSPGDWLLLYTDGITEAFSDRDEMFGTPRLAKMLIEAEYSTAKALVDLITSKVLEFVNGTTLSDDITLAAIHRELH